MAEFKPLLLPYDFLKPQKKADKSLAVQLRCLNLRSNIRKTQYLLKDAGFIFAGNIFRRTNDVSSPDEMKCNPGNNA